MATYRLTSREVDFIAAGSTLPKEVLGVACLAPDHDIDTFYDGGMVTCYMGSPSVKREIIIPPVETDLWTCPYCYALNYVKVGHCHHCAGPRR